MTTMYAPCVNLVASTMTSTSEVTHAPSALIARERCIVPRARVEAETASRCVQCRTMPAWLSVNETNTPMMYSWIRWVVLALNATISALARTARITTPLLNTSRSPRRANWRGR